ncbi:unnamed protein product [Choristocarpus tenellus]
MGINPVMMTPGAPINAPVQTAVKNMQSGAVIYFNLPVDMLQSMIPEVAPVERGQFAAVWKSIDSSRDVYSELSGLPTGDVELVSQKLLARNIYFVARKDVPQSPTTPAPQCVIYFSFRLVHIHILVEITFTAGMGNACRVCIKTEAQPYASVGLKIVEAVLRQ